MCLVGMTQLAKWQLHSYMPEEMVGREGKLGTHSWMYTQLNVELITKFQELTEPHDMLLVY